MLNLDAEIHYIVSVQDRIKDEERNFNTRRSQLQTKLKKAKNAFVAAFREQHPRIAGMTLGEYMATIPRSRGYRVHSKPIFGSALSKKIPKAGGSSPFGDVEFVRDIPMTKVLSEREHFDELQGIGYGSLVVLAESLASEGIPFNLRNR